MSFMSNPFRTKLTELMPLGLPADQYLQVCQETPPKHLGVAITAYYSGDVNDEAYTEMMLDFGVVGGVISELIEHEEFRCEFCPPGLISTKVERHFVLAPPQFWFDYPHMKGLYCSGGVTLQLAFFDATRNPTGRQYDGLACAMGHLDHVIDLAGTLDPAAHPPILAGHALSERYADFVGNVYGRIGKWSESLARLRNCLLIGAAACLENKPMIKNMRRFVQSEQISYLGFDITS